MNMDLLWCYYSTNSRIDQTEKIALEEEFNKMIGMNDEHDCNVVSVNSLNIQNANDECTSHDNDVSYKNVNFYGVNWECTHTTKREDKFCKRHKYLETKWLQERLDVCAENLNFLIHPCELCNEHGHLNTQCKLFHD